MSTELHRRFIYETLAGVPTCHASTVVELANGDLLAAWYGGVKEGTPDSSHYCARLRSGAAAWNAPQLLWDVPGHAAGNPRLFTTPDGILWALLPINDGKWCNGGTKFYRRLSHDQGQTWSEPVHTPELDTLLGKNKPVVYPDGRFVVPVTMELTKASASIVYHPDTEAWTVSEPIFLPGQRRCIQPTFEVLADGRLLAMFRTNVGRIWQSYSSDRGDTWTEPVETELRNNESGIDLARLPNGHLVLAFNDTTKGRTPLNLAVSTDDGKTWPRRLVVEDVPGEYSYPAVITARGGFIHLLYTHQRTRIAHLAVREESIKEI
jgi:predicted neuraminidase